VNFARTMERLREVRANISEFEAAKRLKSLGIDVFVGRGVFDSASSIVVNGERIRFRKCIICSGGKAYIPNLPGLDTVPFLTNESLFNLTELPKSMLVVGGGPIGIEMAQSFQRFGTQVTVLIRGKKILDKEDLESALIVEESLRKDGIQIVSCALNQRFQLQSDGKIAVTFEEKDCHATASSEGKEEKKGEATRTLIVEKVLVATGRRASVKGFGLEKAGVKFTEQNGIIVDDFMKTSNPLIFAAGDCCSHYQFTHAADHMARICIVNALFYGNSKFSSLLMPWCTFTEPEIAHVGLYPRDMETRNIPYDTYIKEFSDNDRAVCEGSTEGFVKIHVKKGTDKIIGATIVGDGAGDMISEVCTLMHAKIGLAKLASIIHPYPTRADAIRQIGDQYNEAAMTPFMRKIMKSILSFGL
jgi:pyruvate/2-oxoglutarate dehydrogenase complex dihydrolipoamide dehydrogenase (E3) component